MKMHYYDRGDPFPTLFYEIDSHKGRLDVEGSHHQHNDM